MAVSGSDIFVIITLWLVYVGIHVCMDFLDRRARRRAEEQAEAESLHRANRGVFVVTSGDSSRTGRTQRGVHVVVVGAETDAATLRNTEPCEGSLVPDATGNVPQLPAPVQYGEATYAPRGGNEDAAVLIREGEQEIQTEEAPVKTT